MSAGVASPFVGPRPFELGQADMFKGREQEVDRLEALVLSRRVVLFYAASGVGKSSLINAGLVPKLLHGDRGIDCDLLGVVRVSASSGSEIDANVFTTSILGQLPDGLKSSSLLEYLKNRYAPRDAGEPPAHKLALLVIDQFEEMFTTFPERWRDRLPFMAGLLESLDACAAADPNIDRAEGSLFKTVHLRIVFCLREEYIAYLEQYYDLFPELRTARFRLEPLRREQARRAILEPTRASGRPFSEALVQEIISELIQAPQVTAHDSRLKPRDRWAAWLQGFVRRMFFHVPEVGHRDQQYVVEGEYVEPVQLQVICSDIWESAAPGEKVVTRESLPKDWSVDVGLGRFYDQAIEYACRPPSEPASSAASIWSGLAGLLRWRSFSPIRLRRWISDSLITDMGTRAPVLLQLAETEIPARVLERLQNRYLLRLEPRFGADWLELAHDRLVGPMTRSNTRHIAAFNNNRVRLALSAGALCVIGAMGVLGGKLAGASAHDELVRYMKDKMDKEPDLAVLVQACARSDLAGAATNSLACPKKDSNLSADIVRDSSERATRQPELHAYVASPFGTIKSLERQGEGYRVALDDGKSFLGLFASPAIPSAETEATPCARSGQDAKATAGGGANAAQSCASPNDGLATLKPPAVGASDAAREYDVAFQCDPRCGVKLKRLDASGNDWATVKLDKIPGEEQNFAENLIGREVAASGKTLLLAVCPADGSCAAKVYVYRLSDDNSTATQVGALPGTFDLITMAASATNVAVAYRSVGDSIKVKVVPANLEKPASRWLPDGSRIFDVPFNLMSSLLFNEDGDVLIASAGDNYLIDWNLRGTLLGAKTILDRKLKSPLFAQSAAVAENGNIAIFGLGLSPDSRDADKLQRSCLDVVDIGAEGPQERENDGKCANSTGAQPGVAGWSVIASDATGSIIAAANPFTDKGMVFERREDGYRTIDVSMPDGNGVVAISVEGDAIAIGNRNEHVGVWTKSDKGRYGYSDLGSIDPSCVMISGPQHRIAAIVFDPNDNSKVLVATQEGCLAIFKRTDKGWKSQWVDMQIPDVTSASISPDSHWAAFGTGSGRIQIRDINHPTRPANNVEAHLPWASSFAWLSADQGPGRWMILGNSRSGPVGAWLIPNSADQRAPPKVLDAFPPTWIDKAGVVSVGARREAWFAATTDGRLLQFDRAGTPQAIIDGLIDRACEIASPLVHAAAVPQSPVALTDFVGDFMQASPTHWAAEVMQLSPPDFVGEVMQWSRKRCSADGDGVGNSR